MERPIEQRQCAALREQDDRLALRCVETMLSEDHCSAGLGMVLEGAGAGWAKLRMPVTRSMINGYNVCHGGLIFALADSTFACSCNGYNRVTVASGCQIEYLRPALLGDVLSAHGSERKRGKWTGVYDIEIRNQKKQLVALFRGKSFTTQKPIIERREKRG
ncbi:MAG: hydroxyphenylacetyl-CoA thioesterase PaaI [Gammaproteobacteria bacterium]|nr:hydroxyphenylacetyl-CoA thioesterase PaaI [Gammaproteobacteria bacterium]